MFALLSWLRGFGSATGLYFLEPFIMANIPAFLWLGDYGLRLAPRRPEAREQHPTHMPDASSARSTSV